MKKYYKLPHRLIACILLLSLFLQSCGGSLNQVIPREKESTNNILKSTKQIVVNPLVDQELTAEKGYLVNFYEKDGKLLANVRVDESHKEPNYRNLPVAIEDGIDLVELPHLTRATQKLRIQLGRVQSRKLSHVMISKAGLLAGMKKGNEEQKNKGKEKEKEKEEEKRTEGDLSIYQRLFEFARQGDQEAQFQLGERAYNLWKDSRKESAYVEAIEWLSKAAEQRHEGAVALLAEMGSNMRSEIELKKGAKKYNDLGRRYYKKGDEDESVNNNLEYRKDLLERARKGEDKAQFELGEWAYNAWQRQDQEGDIDEALHWLIQAKAQGYLPAINLLQKIKKCHPELVEKINKKLAERNKGKEKDKRKEMKETRKEIKNDLPSILYDASALSEVLNEIKMDPLKKKQANLYLENIHEKVNKIRDYQSRINPKLFYRKMKEYIDEIHNMASSLYDITKPCDHVFSNELKNLIVGAIGEFEKELDKILEMPAEVRQELELKTKRLYAEQSYIVRREKVQEKLEKHLEEIKRLLTREEDPFSPRCYISYAWPSKENKEEEYWIQPFLTILYNHLSVAGIRMVMDIRDNKAGDSIYQFMKQYHTGNYIILIGTPSLLAKHYSSCTHAVQTELSIISSRFEKDYKSHGYSRIYPLLLSGTIGSSFPETYDKYRTVRDGRKKGYILMLKDLLDHIYGQRIDQLGEGTDQLKEDYERLWHNFDEEFKGLPSTADAQEQEIEEELNEGYHHQRLEYLKKDNQYKTVQAQEQTKHSSAVTAKMVGVLIESQGNNPRSLYSEYGQQFQHPSITPDFVERQKLWKKIVSHFEQSEHQILTLSAHGLGGMGKTELAKYYYLFPPRPYELRAWFNAENRGLLYLQYVDLARDHGIEFPKEMPIEEQVRQIKNWLGTQKDYLLVYDNVPNVKHLEGLLPQRGKHHILITSRNEEDWPVHQRLDVDVMEEDEAIELIWNITGFQEETVGVKELASILNYLPLALAQAGAYIAATKTSIEDYLDLYRKYQAILMSDETLTQNPKHEPVWVTFNMNFKALETDCPNALATLKQVSWLSSSVVPGLLLKTMLEDSKDEPIDLLWGKIKRHIIRYSLMRIDREGRQLSMHRLLQDILRSKQDEAERKQILNQIALAIKYICSDNDEVIGNIALARLLLPHMEMILSHVKRFFTEYECTEFNLESILGNAYEVLANYIKAKEYFYSHLLIQQEKHKNDHIKTEQGAYIGHHADIAAALDNLGRVFNYLGEYQDALEYHQQALKMCQTIHPGNHPVTAWSLNNIGMVCQVLGKNQEALKYLKQSLEMKKALYANNSPYVAQSFNNIGGIYINLCKYKKALKYLQQALETRQALYSGNHPHVAQSLNNIGMVYQVSLGKNQEALKYLKQSLKMRQALYTNDHPDLASSLNNIGMVYKNSGRPKKALKYYEQALAMVQAVYTIGNHTYIAASLDNIGSVYKDLGQPQEALKHYNQALKMYQALYGDNHSDIATSLNNIGCVYYKLDQFQEALKHYNQALKMYQALCSGNHTDIANSLNNIGGVYYRLGQLQEALKYFEQALEMYQQIYKEESHPDIQLVRSNIARLEEQKLKYDKEQGNNI